jgi:hypothetical protein
VAAPDGDRRDGSLRPARSVVRGVRVLRPKPPPAITLFAPMNTFPASVAANASTATPPLPGAIAVTLRSTLLLVLFELERMATAPGPVATTMLFRTVLLSMKSG